MARRFGGGLEDFLVVRFTLRAVTYAAPGQADTTGDLVVFGPPLAPTAVWLYDSADLVNGVRQTNLRLLDGTLVDQVMSTVDGQIPEFDVLVDDVDVWWADASGGAGPRQKLIATDIGLRATDALTTAESAEASASQVAPLSSRVTTLEQTAGSATYA